MAWWLWRGINTRSHPELDSESPLRLWYFVLRRGRVGRCQAFYPLSLLFESPHTLHKLNPTLNQTKPSPTPYIKT